MQCLWSLQVGIVIYAVSSSRRARVGLDQVLQRLGLLLLARHHA